MVSKNFEKVLQNPSLLLFLLLPDKASVSSGAD